MDVEILGRDRVRVEPAVFRSVIAGLGPACRDTKWATCAQALGRGTGPCRGARTCPAKGVEPGRPLTLAVVPVSRIEPRPWQVSLLPRLAYEKTAERRHAQRGFKSFRLDLVN